jgi:hypothetical protein
MVKATDALLTDHRMIRKTMEGFVLSNPRFAAVLKTLNRVVAAHAWFEDEIFLPALKAEPLLERLNREISEEHQDIGTLFPLAERILDSEGLNRLGDEMTRRKADVRAILPERPSQLSG